jgi:hypothetical protein
MNLNAPQAGRKPLTIIVNGREKQWSESKISFREVVILAFGSYEDTPQILYTVTHKPADKSQHEGTMVDGDEVNVHPGMIFNVARSDKS